MSDGTETYGIEALAAAAMAAPPRRYAVLLLATTCEYGNIKNFLEAAEQLAKFIEEGDPQYPVSPPSDEGIDPTRTTETRSGIHSFGQQ